MLAKLKLPPLNSLRAFEAAARHSSFRLAAAELFVTPGAVSQQVRQLEDYLGLSLFERLPRAVRLTRAGQDLFAAATRHLRGIAQAVERLKPQPDTMTISTVPTFASRWLMPRLPHFTMRCPSVEVRVDATPDVVDLEQERYDLAVRYGKGSYPGVHARLLFQGIVAPLCSRAYRAEHFDGRDPDQAWRTVRLLHENPPDDYWPGWREGTGLAATDAEAGMYFSHGLLALSAAIEGQGVALQPIEFVERELASGALVLADEHYYDTGRGYYLLWPRRELRPAVENFRDWLLNEMESSVPASAATRRELVQSAVS